MEKQMYAFYCGYSRGEGGVVVILASSEEEAWRTLWDEWCAEYGESYEEWKEDQERQEADENGCGWYLFETGSKFITCDGH